MPLTNNIASLKIIAAEKKIIDNLTEFLSTTKRPFSIKWEKNIKRHKAQEDKMKKSNNDGTVTKHCVS